MRNHSLIIKAAISLAAVSPAAQPLESRVDDYLEPYLATANFQGSVLIAERGEILYAKGFGFADREHERPNTPDTGFHLASVSRVVTAIAVMLLVQDGKLSVDDSLADFFPDWPRGDEITIHHLLTLSAGFPNINEMAGYVFWLRFEQDPASLVEKFRDDPLEFEPGTRTVHSNSNYVVLALLIETISGMPFGEFLEQRIFAPLGMHGTSHDGDSERTEPHWAVGYAPVGRGDLELVDDIHWSAKSGHGSLISTTVDLYRLDRALVRRELLEEAAIQTMFTEYFPSTGYGWGVRRRFDDDQVLMSGSSPGFGAFWGRAVGRDVTVVVLGNIYSTVPGTLGRDLLDLALGQPVAVPIMHGQRPDPDLLEELVGTYQFGPDFYRRNGLVSISVVDGHLFSGGLLSGRWWLMATSRDEMTFQHRRYWSILTFRRDENGDVTALQFDDFVGKRTTDVWPRFRALLL